MSLTSDYSLYGVIFFCAFIFLSCLCCCLTRLLFHSVSLRGYEYLFIVIGKLHFVQRSDSIGTDLMNEVSQHNVPNGAPSCSN